MKEKIDNVLFGKAISLNKIVEYQDNTIISRTLIQKASGTVTLFAFDAGQGLSEHTAPFDAMVNLLDGEGVIIIDGNEHNLSSGDCIIMPANVPHAVKAEKRFKMLLVMIK